MAICRLFEPPRYLGTGAALHESFNVDLPTDIDTALRAAANTNDVWIIEYVRAAIAHYADKIEIDLTDSPRRRRRKPSQGRVQTFNLGTTAKQQLANAAKRTNLTQARAFRRILKAAIDDNFHVALNDD